MTRARPMAGTPALQDQIEAFRLQLLQDKSGAAEICKDVADMRARLAEAKPLRSPWGAKQGAGRMQDIELLGQSAALLAADPARAVADQLAAGQRIGWLDAAQHQTLMQTYQLLWKLRETSKLLSEEALDMDKIGEAGRSFVLRELGHDSLEALQTTIETAAAAADQVITALLQQPMNRPGGQDDS